MRSFCWAVLCALVLTFGASASAQSKLKQRELGVQWEQGSPRVSFSARDLVDKELRKDLTSGLRKRIVVTAQAYVDGSKALVATRKFECAVTYDLWESQFIVKVGNRRENAVDIEKVLERCLVVKGLIIGTGEDFERHKGRNLFFAIRAEFNPITKSQCRALVRTGSGGDPIGPLVVNIVRRRICGAERAIGFRSQSVPVLP